MPALHFPTSQLTTGINTVLAVSPCILFMEHIFLKSFPVVFKDLLLLPALIEASWNLFFLLKLEQLLVMMGCMFRYMCAFCHVSLKVTI